MHDDAYVGADAIAELPLVFTDMEELENVGDALERDISALCVQGRSLFCACDETANVERLVQSDDGFTEHESFNLGAFFDLPGDADGEMDIEGLAIDGGYLWVTGSHGLKRDKLSAEDADLYGVTEPDYDPNRSFLGRIPLEEERPGIFRPVAKARGKDDAKLRAARCKLSKKGFSVMRHIMAKDPLLAPFLNVPCKENGFDIEGLAVRGSTVWLGLRGPVIGGYAIIVELTMKRTKKGHLKPRKRYKGKRYRLLALPLEGLGIRDLHQSEDGLLILAGATTDIDSAQGVFFMPYPDAGKKPAIVPQDRVARVLDLPMVLGADHAEGLAALDHGGTPHLAIAFDAPREARVDFDRHRLDISLYPMPDH